MPFHLTSDQELLRKTIRELVEEFKGNPAEEVDRDRAFPADALRKVAPLGLTGLLVPPEHGGPGTDAVTFALALEETARASGTLALVLNNLNALGTRPVALHGTGALRAKVLPGALAGEAFVAWAVTEPNAGSDLGALGTRARKEGDGYVLSGLKSFVVGAPEAAWFLVFARLQGVDGLTAFAVPADAPGLRVAPPERTMTLRGSRMAQVFLKDVPVPADHVLGPEGGGLPILQEANVLAELGAAAMAVGLMEAAFQDAAAFANQREQFRTPIKKFQAIQFQMADLDIRIRAARLLVLAAADKRDRGEDAAVDVAAAKLFAAESAKVVTQKAIRIHGGAGFMRDLPVERYNRDARALSIYAGTAEAERALLAQKALGL